MRYCIIANPRSGRGRGAKLIPAVEARLRGFGAEFETRVTTAPGDARRFAQDASAAGFEVLVVLGGDGSLFEVVNGIMEGPRRPRIAQIPVGTGNSFIKDLGISNFEEGLAALEAGKTRRVDIAKGSSSAGEFHFINLAGAGFVARTAKRAQAFKAFGDLAYVIAVLIGLPGLRAGTLTIVADGVETRREALFVEICNSTKTGGDMVMAPGARVDDGLLDVIIAKAMSRRQLLELFPLIFSGRHVESHLIESFTCSRIEACFDPPEPVTPDGELLGETPLRAEVLPAAIEIYCA